MLAIHLWINIFDSDWGRGQIQWHDPIAIPYIRAYILYSLCIYCIINCSFSMQLHLFIIYIYDFFFQGLVIIFNHLITIGWCPRVLAQSRLWIIRPWGLWLSHWLPSDSHCQGTEKYEKHCQNSPSAISGSIWILGCGEKNFCTQRK